MTSEARISKEEMYMRMAEVAASRSSCERTKVGAVLTDLALSNVLSIGYNGPPKYSPNKCPAGPLTPGACGCIHAEINALLKAPFDSLAGQILFVTLSPCLACASVIINSNIRLVYYRNWYRNTAGLDLIASTGKIGAQVIGTGQLKP